MSVASKVVNKPMHPIHLASKLGGFTVPKRYQQVYEQSEQQKSTYFMSGVGKVVNKPGNPIYLASKLGVFTVPHS
jgi:hypothetical protein